MNIIRNVLIISLSAICGYINAADQAERYAVVLNNPAGFIVLNSDYSIESMAMSNSEGSWAVDKASLETGRFADALGIKRGVTQIDAVLDLRKIIIVIDANDVTISMMSAAYGSAVKISSSPNDRPDKLIYKVGSRKSLDGSRDVRYAVMKVYSAEKFYSKETINTLKNFDKSNLDRLVGAGIIGFDDERVQGKKGDAVP